MPTKCNVTYCHCTKPDDSGKGDDALATSSTSTVEYVIRDARPSDEGFIASSYVATARMSTPRGQLNRMPQGAFTAYHYAHVGKLLKSCTAQVACNPEDEERLYGFSITEGHTVHCVYVSKSHWRSGIGKALLRGVSLSDAIFRLWPNTMHGSDTEWLWPRIESLTYLPYWMESSHGGSK